MWQCASIRPGKMNLPVASMTVSSGVSGRIEPSVSPTRVIRFPSTTRSLFGTGSPPDPSIKVPVLTSSRMALAMTTASLKVGKTEHAIRRYGSPAKSGVEGLQRAGRPHRDGPGSERKRGGPRARTPLTQGRVWWELHIYRGSGSRARPAGNRLARRANPTFATRGIEAAKLEVFCGVRSKGRHHTGRCHGTQRRPGAFWGDAGAGKPS